MKLRNRLVEYVHSTWSCITCHILGHLYRPMFEVMSKPVIGRNKVRTIKVVRYTCEQCGQKTPWMNSGMHKMFEREQCPTWGDRGSDSQNYKGDGEHHDKEHYN